MTWEMGDDMLDPFPTYDSNVINMCKFAPNHTVIDMYIEKITPEECVFQEMEFIKSFEPIAQSSVVIEEINGDEDDQCKLVEERLVQVRRPVQMNRGKAKLAIEYPVSGLGGAAEDPLGRVGDEVVGDDFVADKGVLDERVADEGVPDEWVDDE
ncbi:hypothetical protein DVH24_030173 [Malus domestica]|uniref:Uncharacterized protein n=1 Tax=Malus domestica TaxID=3750 RepID=A0A498HZP5_MALDO|nr:hypothetical protein DVH24_030173 [Malus domestica]